jgi:alditol oxidase
VVLGRFVRVVTLQPPTNWAGNVTFACRALHRPTGVAQLQELVAGSDRVRALGSGHSFSPVADTTGELVLLDGLPRRIEVDAERSAVTVSAGVRFGELGPVAHRAGLALRTLGSLPHISVAGACATGTHGSGDRCGTLASSVSAVELVDAAGELVVLDRADPDFAASVLALGCRGIVTALTLELVPTFDVRQWVYEDVPTEDLGGVLGAAYSVSAFSSFAGPRFEQVWLKRRVDEGEPDPGWRGGHRADGPRHMTRGVPPEHTTEQGGVPGPWHERLPHFRPEFAPSHGDELQSEYLVDRVEADAAFAALTAIGATIAPVLHGCELRSVAADELWLSPAYRRDSLAVHFTWVSDVDAVLPVVRKVEEALEPFAPRPHWGKIFTMEPAVVRSRYPRLPDAQALFRRTDPTGRFRNPMVDRYLPG